jgi:acetyltransferase-like isoleucine patch superfamily enzyme
VVGCKTVVAEDVPPYAVVVGSPARVVRYLDADDTAEERGRALREHAR